MITISMEVCIMILIVLFLYATWRTIDTIIFPFFVNKTTTDIEVNPKWITSKIKPEWYGLHDIDFVIVKSIAGTTPRFRIAKDKTHLQFLISEDTSVDDIEELLQTALAGKIKIKYGVWYPDKSIQWLSILCFLLDGGNMTEGAVSLKPIDEEKDNKPIDDTHNL